MIITTDRVIDTSYIKISDAPYDHTEELADGLIVDVGPDDTVIGVEIISVSRGWSSEALAARFHMSTEDLETMMQLTTRTTIFGSPSTAGSETVAAKQQPLATAGQGRF